MIESIVEFIRTHMPGPSGLVWVVLISLVGMLLALLTAGYVVVRVPSDYFHNPEARRFWTGRHPVLRVLFIALKNLLGIVLLAVGLVMVFPGVPGPGALMVLIAILFLDFPGKMRLERWLFGRPLVFAQINRLRARYGRPPIVIPPPASSATSKAEKRSVYE